MATCCSAALLAMSAGTAVAAPVTERSISGAKLDTGYGLTAGYGYVAWIDDERRGSRRIAVRQPDGSTRRAWLPGQLTLSLRRQTDLRTGRPVTRLVTVRRRPVDGTSSTTLRSPTTLRRTATEWAPSVQPQAVDGAASVETAVEPDMTVPADPAKAPPSRCVFAVAGVLPAIPPLPDCGASTAVLRGPTLAIRSVAPSGTSADRDKGQVNASALSVFSADHPEVGWRRLATSRDDYDGRVGLQSFCASDRGVALLEGESFETGHPVDTWTLRWVPADPALPGWTASVPQLDETISYDHGGAQLACDGQSIYAQYYRPDRSRSRSTSRVVRFVPPR